MVFLSECPSPTMSTTWQMRTVSTRKDCTQLEPTLPQPGVNVSNNDSVSRNHKLFIHNTMTHQVWDCNPNFPKITKFPKDKSQLKKQMLLNCCSQLKSCLLNEKFLLLQILDQCTRLLPQWPRSWWFPLIWVMDPWTSPATSVSTIREQTLSPAPASWPGLSAAACAWWACEYQVSRLHIPGYSPNKSLFLNT